MRLYMLVDIIMIGSLFALGACLEAWSWGQ